MEMLDLNCTRQGCARWHTDNTKQPDVCLSYAQVATIFATAFTFQIALSVRFRFEVLLHCEAKMEQEFWKGLLEEISDDAI